MGSEKNELLSVLKRQGLVCIQFRGMSFTAVVEALFGEIRRDGLIAAGMRSMAFSQLNKYKLVSD